MKHYWLRVWVLGVSACALAHWGMAQETIQLFNGKDLSGWNAYLVDPAVKMADVWSVRDGLLVCRGEPMGYLFTDRSFTSYELVVEWRWAPGKEPGNSGVLMRVNGEHRALPRSLEAQLKSGDAGDLYGFHGMRLLGTADRMRRTPNHEVLGDFTGITKMSGNEHPPGEWNRYEIRLAGTELTVKVNGKLVNQASGCEETPGPIALQSEGGEIHFRRVELRPLD